MSRFWLASVITGGTVFLETCGFYLLIGLVSNVFHRPDLVLDFWLVMLTLLWAYVLSSVVQSLQFSRNLRGAVGLGFSVLSILALSHLSLGLGMAPLRYIFQGDAGTVVSLVLTMAFLVLLWWRGVTLSHDEINLESVSGAFRWGLVALIVGVLVQSVASIELVNGFLVVGFFFVGLFSLALGRLAWEAGTPKTVTGNWWAPIGLCVAGVVVIGLIVSAAGMGGLDDVTRELLSGVGHVGLVILKPIFLAIGYLASLLVGFGNWVSGQLGGGDLSGVEEAMAQMARFQETLRENEGEGPPAIFSISLKWGAFLVGTGIAGYFLYRILRLRRLFRHSQDYEETRESVYSWDKANRELASLLSGWWNSLPGVRAGANQAVGEPTSPREFYHGLLRLADGVGIPRQEWQTPREHQRLLRGLLPDGPVNRIVDSFQMAEYGHQPASGRDLEQLTQEWADIKRFLAEQEGS